ncbi:hypothetical protein P12x_001329 [Tundrisphaera lichenicola]|uniref:hypothetical protein n=1 Tax=Tundrisphaera lichenicola TaxID=2029860 RepID=UPI003EBE1A76
MSDRAGADGGFTVLDGAALVTGAAVALVHLRSSVLEFDDLWDWAWGSALFCWLAITSAGPFSYLVRKFFSKPPGFPRLGDHLWALAGTPWLLAAIVRTGKPESNRLTGRVDLAYVWILTFGLTVVVLVAVMVIARKCLQADPARRVVDEPTPWTDRLGFLLTVAWPIQCGAGLVLVG